VRLVGVVAFHEFYYIRTKLNCKCFVRIEQIIFNQRIRRKRLFCQPPSRPESTTKSGYPFYCANKRTVCRFKDKGFRIVPVKGASITLLVTSDFLDDAIDDQRDDFDIKPKTSSFYAPLCWQEINEALQVAVREVIYSAYPDLEGKNKEIIASIRNENLHLASYIALNASIGGLVDSDALIENAEKAFHQDKKNLRKMLHQNNPHCEDILRYASDLAGKELIEYIGMRDKVITQFERMDLADEQSEMVIHNHFLKRGTVGMEFTPVPVQDNNLWLLDDKFMTYSYVASEKTLVKLLQDIGLQGEQGSDRFDLAIYSDSQDVKKVILVELKKFSARYGQNGVGILQLGQYAKILANAGVDQIYLYLVAKIDDNFRSTLVDIHNFKRVFSQKGEVYQGAFSALNAYIQVLSPEAIIADARARNQTFIDMVRGQILSDL